MSSNFIYSSHNPALLGPNVVNLSGIEVREIQIIQDKILSYLNFLLFLSPRGSVKFTSVSVYHNFEDCITHYKNSIINQSILGIT